MDSSCFDESFTQQSLRTEDMEGLTLHHARNAAHATPTEDFPVRAGRNGRQYMQSGRAATAVGSSFHPTSRVASQIAPKSNYPDARRNTHHSRTLNVSGNVLGESFFGGGGGNALPFENAVLELWVSIFMQAGMDVL